jgi:hypothetical protein
MAILKHWFAWNLPFTVCVSQLGIDTWLEQWSQNKVNAVTVSRLWKFVAEWSKMLCIRGSTEDCEGSGRPLTTVQVWEMLATATGRIPTVRDLQHSSKLSLEQSINIILNRGSITACACWVPSVLMKGLHEMCAMCCHVCRDILSQSPQA